MTHEEYKKEIKRQQALINRLFNSRKKRSEEIERITKERYLSLVGKFFRADERLEGASVGEYYYIVGIHSISGHAMDNQVIIRLVCRKFYTEEILYKKRKVVNGVCFLSLYFDFHADEDIEALIEPMLVQEYDVITYFNGLNAKVFENFLTV